MRRTQLPGSWIWIAALTVVLLLSSATSMFGQAGTLGTMTGVVTDPSGAVVPDVTVTIKEKATNATQTQTTNSAGRYTFVNLRPGDYEVTITKTGFAKVSIPSDIIAVGETSTNNVTLKVGSESQTVEVASSGVELQTLNATVGSTVNGLSLESLPTLGRDTSTFMTLQSGVSPDGSVAGANVDQSSFQLDGGNNTNDMDGSMSVYTPSYAGDPTGVSNQNNGVSAGPTGVMPTPADSVEEFKVNIAGQSADFNSSAGAQVIVQTKSGTDQWHGTAYWYYLDNNLNANTYINNFNDKPNASFHYNRFGGSIGGPIIPKEILGGKTYFFGNYEGFRYPNAALYERAVPSPSMRLGLLTFGGTTYNLNPVPVTYNGVTYQPSQCPAGPCDPRGIGVNPLISQMWNQYLPLSNEAGCGLGRCDGNNIQGFLTNVPLPLKSNFAVAKIDHNFGAKWKAFASYRYFNYQAPTTFQVDIGGLVPGDKLGVPQSLSDNPQQAWYLVGGLDANLSNTWTNSIRYSYLRNWWQWERYGGRVQVPGLGGALEPGGESATQALIPYNVNNQQTRSRFWNGHDQMIRDDATWIHGKHMVQFGGMFLHNFNWHERTDNGGGINYYPAYQIGAGVSGNNVVMNGYQPAGLAKANFTNWNRDYAMILGMVSISQVAYTRHGSQLTLNPPLTPAQDKVTIPYWNLYGSDTWRLNPKLTLTYGLGWTLEMPPTEQNGLQVAVVDSKNVPISTQQFLNNRETAALQGQVYNPIVGFNLIGNVATHPAHIYNPFYGEWSPRAALAWDVNGDGRTVVRGGYGLTYGRLNGVDLVLVPLLSPGLIQAVQCSFVTRLSNLCGTTRSDPNSVFRVGTDGLVAPLQTTTQTLPQPFYPGVNGAAAGAPEALDPNFRPDSVQSFTFSVARQLNNKMSLEVGYIGRIIHHEYQAINLNAVPYMMTLGGQTFAKAYANLVLQYCGGIAGLAGSGCGGQNANVNTNVTPQPFFEAALKGTGYCNGYASCTQAVADNEGLGTLGGAGNATLNQQLVSSLWADLDNGAFNFPRSMQQTPLPGPNGAQGQLTSGVGMNASVGYGNYNALFITFKTQAWKGMTMQSNFTFGKALGTASVVQATSGDTLVDPFNPQVNYGYQAWDRKYVYNLFIVYQPNFYKSQSGFLGHLLGGWTIAPVFVAGSGLPITLGTIGFGQAFGEGDPNENFAGNGISENAIPITPKDLGQGSRYFGISTPVGSSGVNGANIFKNPTAAFFNVRQPILGYDTRDGGFGVYRGMPYWNVDLSVKKLFKITERFSTEFQVVFTNFFNHDQFIDPAANGGDYLDTSAPGSWGSLNGQFANYSPRQIQFGLRVSF